MRKVPGAGVALTLSMLPAPGGAAAEMWRDRTFQSAEARAIRIVVLKADVLVGSIDSGGVETADPDWTAAARAKLVAQMRRSSGRSATRSS